MLRNKNLNEITFHGIIAFRGIEERFLRKPVLYLINSNFKPCGGNLVPAFYIPRGSVKYLQPEQQVRIIARPSRLHKGRYISRNIEVL